MLTLQAAITIALCVSPGETTLLDFYADWCGPCREMTPVVKQLAALGYPVRQVNIDHERDLAKRFRVDKIPTFIMVADDREVDRVVGPTDIQRLAHMCQKGAKAAQASMLAAAAPNGAMPAIESPAPLQPGTPAGGETSWREPPSESAGQRAKKTDQELIACSVRLRIEDPDGRSCGSGTIIDCRQGEALIITCGHIFRDSKGKGRVEVDLFAPTPMHAIPGRVISYDLQRDVGLVSVRVPTSVAVARVAPADYVLRPGDEVVTVGCDRGNDPLVRRTRLTDGRYAGPPSVQVDEEPVTGRSGGGLFTPDGRIIGVCNACDPTVRKGLYAAVASIHNELDRSNLSFIHREQPAAAPPITAVAATTIATPPPFPKDTPPRPVELLPTAQGPNQPATPAALPAGAPLSKEEQALLDELQKRLTAGAEVVCIVRPRDNPQGKSEILVLERSSPALLNHLANQPQAGAPATR